MIDIQIIQQELVTITNLLEGKRLELRRAKIANWTERTGLKIGDEVVYEDNADNQKGGVITGFDTRWDTDYPEVTPYKKDGTLGVRPVSWGLNNLRKA